MKDSFILFDNSLDPEKSSILLSQPHCEIKAQSPNEIEPSLRRIDSLQQKGFYVGGYMSYECTHSLHNTKEQIKSEEPLLHFFAFSKKEHLTHLMLIDFIKNQSIQSEPSFIKNFTLSENFGTYKEKLQLLKDYLEKGESYQINYTMNSSFEYTGHFFQLYLELRKKQPVEYGAIINFPNFQSLSFSPELFFRKDTSTITSKPMKGTMARSSNPETDQKIIQQMKQDEKIISENLMIVDMIRNDLSKIAHPGSVYTKNLFEVETYKTIHQMTSTVLCTVDTDLNFSKIIKNIFPCASITGAPKKRTVEIIDQLENRKRGIYTGTIGFISPNNDMCFNVPIRTIVSNSTDSASMGLGGGILHESSIEDEYQECLDKSLFLRKLNEDFYLIESIYFDGHTFYHLDRHLKRLKSSADFFSLPIPTVSIKQSLEKIASTINSPQKIRIQLFQNNKYEINNSPIFKNMNLCSVDISSQTMDSTNRFLKHKTNRRDIYESEYKDALKNDLYERLFFNEKGELTEACRHNIFIQSKGQLYSPPTSCGLLPGIQRELLLEQGAKEKILFKDDLINAEKIFLTNSIRGQIEVKLV